jgi:hypothetical protein
LNPRRILRFAAAIGAVAAAAAVVIVAASFALYAWVKDYLGAAGAAAVVAAVFAMVAVIIALIATRKAVPPRRRGEPEPSLPERALQLAKERPLIALAAAAAAGVVVVRNPGLVTALVSAFVAGNASKPEK